MDRALKKYLARHAALENTPLEWIGEKPDTISLVVVIPVLAEYPGLVDTLNSLGTNNPQNLNTTLVILVVNNRNKEHAAPGDIANNQTCLKALREYSNDSPIHLALIDASSPGKELGAREGVGHARKMGMDWAAQLLGEQEKLDAPIVCLDADTQVQENYLDAIKKYFLKKSCWGVVIDYDHPKEENAVETPGILAYELYLRYCELGLLYAQSPYAYTAIGSAMACSVQAYIAAGGMKRRAAAEDFYFLQTLAKTGKVEHCRDTCVYPSARTSHRAPIGTGKHVADFLKDTNGAYDVYNPESYQALRRFFQSVNSCLDNTVPETGCAALQEFLDGLDFKTIWKKLHSESPAFRQCLQQFHTWFDALRTLRCIHHLRDNTYSNVDTLIAIRTLATMIREDMPGQADSVMVKLESALDAMNPSDWHFNFEKQVKLIEAMRALTMELAYTAGVRMGMEK
jgi:hypothetical protein